MEKIRSIINAIRKKSVKINLGERTYRMRLLTLSIFALAVFILLIAIIVLIIVNACSPSGAEEELPSPTPTSVSVAVDQNGEETESENTEGDIEPVDPVGLPSDDIESPEPLEPETPEISPEPENTPEPTPGSSTDFSVTLKSGDTHESVKIVQQRLVDLYYMDYPVQENGSYSVTTKFGSTTSSAVKLFQERNNLTPTGDCDPETYSKLMSNNANPYIMKQNDKCNMVKTIQTKLKEKGYLDKVTSFCGNDTITAITNFQKASGLTPDGIAGPGTLKVLLGH